MLICFWDQDKVSTFRVIQSPYPYHTNPNSPIPHFLYRYKRHLLLAGRILHIFVWNRFPKRWRISSMKFVRCNPPQKPFPFAFFCSPTQYYSPTLSPYTLCRNAEIHFLSKVFVTSFIPSTYECNDSAYMTHTQVQDFIFLLSTQNKLLDPFIKSVTSSDKSVIVTLHSFFV